MERAEALEVTIIVPEGGTPACAIAEEIRTLAAAQGAHLMHKTYRGATAQEVNAAVRARERR